MLLFDQPGRINVWRNSFQACWWHYMTATSQALDAVGLDPAHDHFDVSSCEAEMPQRGKVFKRKLQPDSLAEWAAATGLLCHCSVRLNVIYESVGPDKWAVKPALCFLVRGLEEEEELCSHFLILFHNGSSVSDTLKPLWRFSTQILIYNTKCN